jgi:dTDP-4-amino-4,6-dideoxygalactose transaminase
LKIIPPEALAGPIDAGAAAKEKLPAGQAVFFSTGRDAIHHAYRSLGIGQGDCVLAPALICRSAVEPIAATGARIQFVDVAPDLDYDEDLLEAAFVRHRPRSLLAVHHFGRRPRLERYRELCSRFGSLLIEDRCHSLPSTADFSADLIGDYAIYSLRKFLPVPDGGVLACRTPGFSLPGDARDLSLAAHAAFLLQRLGKMFFYSGICNPYAVRRRRPAASAGALQARRSAYGPPQRRPSLFLKKWLAGARLASVADRHRRNYHQLAAMLPADIVCRLRDSDGAGNGEAGLVPVALPILDSSPAADWVDRLRALGIGAYAWPGAELPQEVRGGYPQAERCARRLVMLPVHYGLAEADLAYLASVVSSMAALNGAR